MHYLVIERFHAGKVRRLYERFDLKGRMLPEGVRYVSSWIDEPVARCFQVMECDDAARLHEWIGRWSDLADFEVIPVITSAEARARTLTRDE